MDYRDLIASKINGMTNIQDRETLRVLAEEVIIPMWDHNETQYQILEDRIRNELPYRANQYSISVTVAAKEQARSLSTALHPMCPDDLSAKYPSIAEIRTEIEDHGYAVLETVFVQSDWDTCKRIELENRRLSCRIKIHDEQVPVYVRLRPAKRYRDCIEELYRIFCLNGVAWTTLNAPYLFKFFDVVLTDAPQTVSEDAGISSIQIDYAADSEMIVENLVPLWNVDKIKIESGDFPVPAVDRQLFEYHYDLNQEGLEHGYLVDISSASIVAARREESKLIVASPNKAEMEYDVVKIYKCEQRITEKYEYPLMTNWQEESFAQRMVQSYGLIIKTRTELTRMLRSYEAAAPYSLDEIKIVEGIAAGDTYDANHFHTDEIRDGFVSKTLMMKFRRLSQPGYLDQDVISFLVAQVQLAYPEFHCAGVLS